MNMTLESFLMLMNEWRSTPSTKTTKGDDTELYTMLVGHGLDSILDRRSELLQLAVMAPSVPELFDKTNPAWYKSGENREEMAKNELDSLLKQEAMWRITWASAIIAEVDRVSKDKP